METAIYIREGIRQIITLDDYANLIAGKEKEDWPEICCVACDKVVFQQGLFTATEDYTPRFRHRKKAPNAETCPLESDSKRFNALDSNEKSVSSEESCLRRERFMEPLNFRLGYLICRHLRGGQGQLTIKAFARMVEVADSIDMWRYAWLPDWSIPLMLMLMANHDTRNGQYQFYYRIKKKSRSKHTGWDATNVHLVACWLDSGVQITEVGQRKSSFPHVIPLSPEYVSEIKALVEHDVASWAGQENFMVSLERYRLALLNRQQLQDE